MSPARGFTLVEVLVALGIVAIALLAGLQATTALVNNAMRQSDVLLAHLCAENELSRCACPGRCQAWERAPRPASRRAGHST